jgi:CRP-like cAMP-binding protein
MTATAIAVEDTEAIAISAERLLEICQLNAQVGYELMRRMALALSKRLLATRLQLLDLFSAEAPLTRS